MKKVSVFIILNCLFCVYGFAQTRARVFDTLDSSRGIQIVTPAVATAATTAPANKKLVKKTSQVKASAHDAVSVKDNVSTSRFMMSKGTSLGNFTTGDPVIDAYIVDSSLRYNIDPLLIYAQMHQESGFKRRATSYKGASGLMQLMPATAMRFGVTNIYDPKQNIDAGVKYMRWLINKFNNDISLALAGYNAGEGAVMKYGYQIPPYNETREYVRRISTRYNAIKNPYAAQQAVKKATPTQIAKLEEKTPAPLTVYEPNALTVRLPDGRMRLVNQ